MKLKICGMTYPDNLAEVAKLQPDYLGFIFYEKSPRYMANTLTPEVVRALPSNIRRVGVFVDAATDYMQKMAERYGLHALQLHGQEPPEQCQQLRESALIVMKVFSIGQGDFNVDALLPYQSHVDFFLFDTKGKHPGGNGLTFDWNLLQNYSLDVPFFLSGGIGAAEVKASEKHTLPQLYALDVNSRFETKPGLKQVSQLHELVSQLRK